MLFYLKYRKNILQKQYEIKAASVQYQKDLLKAVINSQEEERKRIGMDLHDEIGSKLASLRFIIDNFSDGTADKNAMTTFNQQCKNNIDNVITNVRNISHNLSPILQGTYELYDAIEDLCNDINQSKKIKITLAIQQSAQNVPLEFYSKLGFYRVITELINNTIKHAAAENIYIDIYEKTGIYSITYKDDGKGLPADNSNMQKGMGFKNIESRLESIGATYTINSLPAKGFTINITLPLHA